MDAATIHVHVGLAIFLGFSLVFRRFPNRWVLSLCAVALAELGNEALDIVDAVSGITAPNWRNGLVDLADTLLWPLVITAMQRVRLL